MSRISDRLREERERLGVSQEVFGRWGGVRKQSQSQYERGKSLPSAGFLTRIAQHGADVNYIVTGQRSAAAVSNTFVPSIAKHGKKKPLPADLVLARIITWLEDWWATASRADRSRLEGYLYHAIPEYRAWLEGGGAGTRRLVQALGWRVLTAVSDKPAAPAEDAAERQ